MPIEFKMKTVLRIVAGVLIFINVSSTLSAQDVKLSVGITAGPSYAYFTGTKLYRDIVNNTFRYSFGLSAHYALKPRLSFFSLLNYEQRGFWYEYDYVDRNGDPSGPYKVTNRTNYIVLPLLAQLYVGKRHRFFFTVGLNGAVLLQQTYVNTEPNFAKLSGVYNKNIKRFNVGACTGFGTTLKLRKRLDLEIELRNNLGLINTYKIPRSAHIFNILNSTILFFGLNYSIK